MSTKHDKQGGNIHLPCVNRSETNTSIKGKDIYLGFDCLQNLEGKLAVTIPSERYGKEVRMVGDLVTTKTVRTSMVTI